MPQPLFKSRTDEGGVLKGVPLSAEFKPTPQEKGLQRNLWGEDTAKFWESPYFLSLKTVMTALLIYRLVKNRLFS